MDRESFSCKTNMGSEFNRMCEIKKKKRRHKQYFSDRTTKKMLALQAEHSKCKQINGFGITLVLYKIRCPLILSPACATAV